MAGSLSVSLSGALGAFSGVIALALAVLGGLLVASLLLEPRRTPGTLELLTDARAQLRARSLSPRPSRRERLERALRRRVIDAGFTSVRLRAVLLAFVAAGLGGLLAGRLLFGAPLFAVMGAGLGVYGLWVAMARRARALNRRKRGQIIEFISGMATAVAAGASEREAFAEQAILLTEQPLAYHLSQAQLEIDPRQGLGGRSFIAVLAALDEGLHDSLFHTFYTTMAAGSARAASLKEPLERVAALARANEAFEGEVRADFAQTRTSAAIVYAFPFVITFLMHLLEPTQIEQFYSTPIGLATGIGLAVWCRVFYTMIMRRERAVVALAEGDR